MKLPSLPNTLKRGVGLRILGYFLVAGLIPLVFMIVLVASNVDRGTRHDVREFLHQNAREYAYDLLDNILTASRAAKELDAHIEHGGKLPADNHSYLFERFEGIYRLRQGAPAEILHGEPRQTLTWESVSRIKAGETGFGLLVDQNGSVGQIGLVTGGKASGLVSVFVLAREFAWGADERLPFGVDFCARLADGSVIHCTGDVGTVPLQISDTNFEWQIGEEAFLGAVRPLFLAGDFAAPSIDIIALRPEQLALRNKTDFVRVFVPALLLVMVLVGLLSFSLVGKSLIPLRTLTRAVREIGQGNLDARTDIRAADEFGALGAAFNDMAERLGEQISTLEAMSAIDQLILSGAPADEVAQRVVSFVRAQSGCSVAAVIVRDADTPSLGIMVWCTDSDCERARVELSPDLEEKWQAPYQVEMSDGDGIAFLQPFRDAGASHAAIIPVLLQRELKGALLLSSDGKRSLQSRSFQWCIDLAARFSVALSSAERDEALYRRAHFDELTSLPNRQLLKDRLEQLLVRSRREDIHGALLFIDLDRFKSINDVYGHSVGDIVLVQAAERIVSEVQSSDTVARLGGDEFVVLLSSIDGTNAVRGVAERLLKRLTESFVVHGTHHFVGGSIGIVTFPSDGGSVETLLKNADSAMYRAKEAGRARIEFFSKALNEESRRKIGLERDLREAFLNGDLEIYYQPQFDISTGVICGAEALARWQHPEEGFVSPAEFIPLAEESQLIVDIGRWVIERACSDLRAILDRGLHPGSMSINVSPRQLRTANFATDLLALLRAHDVHPGYIALEITETAVAQNRDTVIDTLNVLRAEGVRVAIDDFGTGYSSLSYLQQLPFDIIKIDKSFVDRIAAGDPSDNICRTIIRMAHELGKEALAEGVELESQFSFLKECGCDRVQGYYYSRPLDRDAFLSFVERQDYHTQRRKALEII